MTKPKLMSTSAPSPSGEDSYSEENLFDQPEERNRAPKAPSPGRDPLDGMTVYLQFPDLVDSGIPWTRQYVNALEEQGKFPKRVHLSGNSVAWIKSEVVAWQEKRNAARDAAPPKLPPAGQPPVEKKLPAKKKPATKLPARRQKRDRGNVAEASDALAAG